MSGERNMRVRFPADRFEATNILIRDLIRMVHGLQNFQLVGGPDWLTTERYDITAKADRVYAPGPEGAPLEVIAMARMLLEERFGFRLRPESRELPIYTLRLARDDGRLGNGMRRVEVDCEAEARRGAAQSIPQDQPRPKSACTVQVSSAALMGRGLTAVQIATAISRISGSGIDRPVIDRTGLKGTFDLDLRWTPELAGGGNDPSLAAPSLFTAVQEQLGLKLEPSRGPVEVFVIDRIERPTPD